MNIIPPIDTSGLWSLNAPFNAKLTPQIPYKLIGIRKLADIMASGGDPEAEYYLPNTLLNADYINDLAANVSILTLQNGSGDIVYVPSSYVNNYPDIGGVSYRVLAVTANIGAIPDTLNLDNLLARMATDIRDLIGVNTVVEIVALSQAVMKSAVDAATLEAARHANVTTSSTDYANYLLAKAERDAARAKLATLEAYVLSKRVTLGI